MNNLKIIGKYLDQPILVSKFEQKVPYLLSVGGIAYTAHDVKHAKANKKKDTAIRTATIMGVTTLSALFAPKIANKMFKLQPKKLNEIKNTNKNLIDKYVNEQILDDNTKKILEKAKTKVLSLNEIKALYNNPKIDEKFLNKFIPNPENISSKEIFSEIGRLSILGLIPVLGGIIGGIIGDKLTLPRWQENVPNKIKEGAYQYLANIFLCNVGAGAALALMEKKNITSKGQRAFGMIGGIVTTGIIGGSAIANIIGNKIINPIFGSKKEQSLYSERKPEALDIGLHTDDIATVAVMSGLKWIEPALPIMYAISGYRAGIGYRNVNKCNEKKHS